MNEPFSPVSVGPGSPDRASTPLSPDEFSFGNAKDQFINRKKDPDPFLRIEFNGDILSPGSPLRGQHVDWRLRGEVPLDFMYPSLHLPSNGSELSPVVVKKAARSSQQSKQKRRGRKMSTLGHKREKVEEEDEDPFDPTVGLRWEVQVADMENSPLLEPKEAGLKSK